MRGTLLALDGDRATVRLTPRWPWHLLGARPLIVELSRDSDGCTWRIASTGQDIDFTPHQVAIRYALEYQEIYELPRARARSQLRALEIEAAADPALSSRCGVIRSPAGETVHVFTIGSPSCHCGEIPLLVAAEGLARGALK